MCGKEWECVREEKRGEEKRREEKRGEGVNLCTD
jgi:hypothetical protein